jgi:Tol biopolymer transport system component
LVIEDDDDADISIYELAETSALRRLTIEGQNRYPVWSSNSERVAFQSDREGDRAIFWQRADGQSNAERLTTAGKDASHAPESFYPDGKHLLYREVRGGIHTLHVLSMDDKKGVPFGKVSSAEPTGAVFSPNGRWVAYAKSLNPSALYSPDRGIFVQPFPANGVPIPVPKVRIDYQPAWAPDGNTLFYVAAAAQPLVSVEVKAQPSITFGVPVEISPKVPRPAVFSGGSRGFDVLPDGRLVIVSPQGEQESSARDELHVVVNWTEELKRLVPSR